MRESSWRATRLDSAEAVTSAMTISEAYSAGPNSSAGAAPAAARTGDDHHRDAAGEERAERGDAQRRPGAALARHRVAVDADHHRGRLARHVQHDRGGRAGVVRAVIDAGQHDQRGDRRQLEGERQQHGDGGDRPEARQHADQRAEQGAGQAVEEILPA